MSTISFMNKIAFMPKKLMTLRPARASRLLAGAALFATLAACAVGPAYHRPEAPAVVPRNADAHFTAAAPDAAWWGQFGDPVLADLEARALADNLDVHIAIAETAMIAPISVT